MNYLTEKVIPTVEHKWSELAYALKFEFAKVKSIKKNNVQDVKEACTEVLGDWLADSSGEPKTWVTLLKALEKIGNGELAKQIRCELTKK